MTVAHEPRALVGSWPAGRRRAFARALRQIPATARWVALLAVLNGIAWGLVIPPFHVPDEISHVAYVQHVAETGELPANPPGPQYSPELRATLDALRFTAVIGNLDNRPPWTPGDAAALERVERAPPSRVGTGNVSSAANNPPLYYLLQAVVYRVSPSADLLDRVALMRIVSALLAGLTAAFAVLFVRELLPATPWAWAAGGSAVALQPMFGFISGGVNNDNLLFAAAAALLFALARTFRRGLTRRRAVAIGAAFATGVLAKATLISFVPALVAAAALLIWRAGPGRRRETVASVAIAIAVAAVPLILYVLALQTIWERPVWSGTDVTGRSATGRLPSLREQLSYAWQLYLPMLPFMTDIHPAVNPPVHVWVNGFVGRFGWLDYGFPAWVYDVARGLLVATLALAGVTLVRERSALGRRLPELIVYLVAIGGLAALIAIAGYRYWLETGGWQFEQARYLLPLLALYAGLIGVAVRAGGRRFGPALSALVVIVTLAWSLYAQLVTVERYWM